MLLKIVLPYKTAFFIEEKLSSVKIRSPASFAASVPEPIAKPTSAALSAGASFKPSPVIAATYPRFWDILTSLLLSEGSALATTLKSGRIFPRSPSESRPSSSEVKIMSFSEVIIPASFAIFSAVSFLLILRIEL